MFSVRTYGILQGGVKRILVLGFSDIYFICLDVLFIFFLVFGHISGTRFPDKSSGE